MISFDKVYYSFKLIYKYIYYLFAINMFLIAGTLLGLVVFGFIPSIIASVYCIKLFVTDKVIVNPIKTFSKKYKEVFKASQIVNLILFILAFLCFKNYDFLLYIVTTQLSIVYLIITLMSEFIIIYLFTSLFVFFPLHYLFLEGTDYKTLLLLSIFTIFMSPFRVIVMFFTNGLIIYLMIKIPVLFIIFGITLLLLNSIIIYKNYIIKGVLNESIND
ncbi:MAG: DUF624 domain-containing protein [Mycoplasmatales bacterium]